MPDKLCIQVVAECTVPEHGPPMVRRCGELGKLRGPTKVGPLCDIHFAALLERFWVLGGGKSADDLIESEPNP